MNDKSSLQACTESFFRHAYAVRRQGVRDKKMVQSLVVISWVPSRKIGRAALQVLKEMRLAPTADRGSAA